MNSLCCNIPNQTVAKFKYLTQYRRHLSQFSCGARTFWSFVLLRGCSFSVFYVSFKLVPEVTEAIRPMLVKFDRLIR